MPPLEAARAGGPRLLQLVIPVVAYLPPAPVEVGSTVAKTPGAVREGARQHEKALPYGGPEAPRQTLSTGCRCLRRPTNREGRSSRWSPPPDRSPPASAARWS